MLTLNVPLRIGKCTPRGTCTPGWEPLPYTDGPETSNKYAFMRYISVSGDEQDPSFWCIIWKYCVLLSTRSFTFYISNNSTIDSLSKFILDILIDSSHSPLNWETSVAVSNNVLQNLPLRGKWFTSSTACVRYQERLSANSQESAIPLTVQAKATAFLVLVKTSSRTERTVFETVARHDHYRATNTKKIMFYSTFQLILYILRIQGFSIRLSALNK